MEDRRGSSVETFARFGEADEPGPVAETPFRTRLIVVLRTTKAD